MDLAQLEEKEEESKVRLSIAEREALIAEAKRRHGADWKNFLGNIKSGLDWESLKFKLGK